MRIIHRMVESGLRCRLFRHDASGAAVPASISISVSRLRLRHYNGKYKPRRHLLRSHHAGQ